MPEEQVLLKARNINKSFSGNHVLKNVSFEIRRGEINALVGENGAGKSTLIKIIVGAYQRDSGDLIFNGQELELHHPRNKAQALGISVIYQELSLIPSLTVAQNIFLGNEPVSRITRLVNYQELNKNARELIKKYNFSLNPLALVESLSIAQRQMVEILKALSLECSLIIMDEPTASLSTKEVEHLFQIIHQLKKMEVSILYISHRMEEVYKIADRVTVLRDGANVAVLDRAEIAPEKIINLMIGRKITDSSDYTKLTPKQGNKVLEIKKLTRKGKFYDISFDLIEGEVLGISGLVGAGRTELIRAIYGADAIDSGEILVQGKKYTPTIENAIKSGFGFVPEDRRLQGIIPEQDIAKNIETTNFDKTGNGCWVSSPAGLKLAHRAIDKVNVKPNNPFTQVINLSGGNQQKVVLGKWLVRDLKVLIIDEPTAGVDVGAKEEIYKLIDEITKQNVSVIVVSSDLPELVRLSDRIIILREGKLIHEFNEGFITEEEILKASSGILCREGAII